MENLRGLHRTAVDAFSARAHAVGEEQWTAPTPCSEWTVRDLVNHLVVEQLWVPPLVSGRTVDDVGTAFDGDRTGDDPARTFDEDAQAAVDAFAAGDALERIVHLSFGDVPGRDYLEQLTADLVIHTWDLARAVGADERLDDALVDWALPWTERMLPLLGESGLFAPPVEVPASADPQTRLLALSGRRV